MERSFSILNSFTTGFTESVHGDFSVNAVNSVVRYGILKSEKYGGVGEILPLLHSFHQGSESYEAAFVALCMLGLEAGSVFFLVFFQRLQVGQGVLDGVGDAIAFILEEQATDAVSFKKSCSHDIRDMHFLHPLHPFFGYFGINFYGNVVEDHFFQI